MFTDKAQAVIDSAKDYAFSSGSGKLTVPALLVAISHHSEGVGLLAQCFGLKADEIRRASPVFPQPATCPGKLPLVEAVHEMLGNARSMSEEVPDRHHPGLIDLRHLVCAVAASREACAILKAAPVTLEDALRQLASWCERDGRSPPLDELTQRLRRLRTELMERVYGQDHAIQAFVEGLFNAEVVAATDVERKRPRALFVFAGPPGVGKTFLTESDGQRVSEHRPEGA